MLTVSPRLFERLSKHLNYRDQYAALSDGSIAIALYMEIDEEPEYESFLSAMSAPLVTHVHEIWRNSVGSDSYYVFLKESDLSVGVAYNRLQENAIVYEETLEKHQILCHISCAVAPLLRLAFTNWQARTAKGATHHERRASPWAQ